MGDRIDELIEEVVVDAQGEDEQLWSFRQAFEDNESIFIACGSTPTGSIDALACLESVRSRRRWTSQ